MRSIVISVFFSLMLTLLVVWCFFKWSTPRIGYVKSPVVIQGYKAMQEAQKKFEGEIKIVQTNLDTLKNRYDHLLAVESLVKEKEKKDWIHRVEIAQGEYEKYNQQSSEQMEKRKEEVTQKLLMQINEFIQHYGKENHYKFILGTTSEGSILYGEEGDDLTGIIVSKLNETYVPEKNE